MFDVGEVGACVGLLFVFSLLLFKILGIKCLVNGRRKSAIGFFYCVGFRCVARCFERFLKKVLLLLSGICVPLQPKIIVVDVRYTVYKQDKKQESSPIEMRVAAQSR